MKLVFLLLIGIGLAAGQVPGFGGCPEFDSQPDFDMNKFLGTWYEAERYVNIFEAGTRCVKTNYTKAVDGRYLVANEIMNRFTSIKRVLEGEIRLVVKGSESKMNVKYPNLPIPYESQLMVLDTDYDSYAVMWSCSSLGIINTQNAWILTRDKLAPGTVLQKAYGVLDKFKLSRTFFVKTDQNSCEIAEAADNSADNQAGHNATPNGNKKPQKQKVGQKKGDQQTTGREEVVQEDHVDSHKSEVPVVANVADHKVVADEKVVDHKVVSEHKVVPAPVVVPVDQKVADHKVEPVPVSV